MAKAIIEINKLIAAGEEARKAAKEETRQQIEALEIQRRKRERSTNCVTVNFSCLSGLAS